MQTKVNTYQAMGMAGELYSDALKSATAYIVNGTGHTDAKAATGKITFSSVPADGDTVSINGLTYTFTDTEGKGEYYVTIASSAAETAALLDAAINATNPFVRSDNSGLTVTLTAREEGAEGNDIEIDKKSSQLTITAMSGGADAVNVSNAKIGNAFTYVDSDTVVMGGTGKFAGIFINPKNQAIYNNLTATLEVPDGTVGTILSSGYVYVVLSNSSTVGDKVYFTQSTGVLGAGTASTGQTQIAGAQIVEGGAAGTLVKMRLIPQTA